MRSPWRFCVLLILLTLALYAPAIRSDFVWDDRWLIATNQVFQQAELSRLVGQALFAQTSMPISIDYFRPVQSFSFWVDRSLFGVHPEGWHLHSLLLHGMNVALVFALLRRLVPESPSDPLCLRVLVGTALFALHPVQAEAVVWISARNELLYSGFALGTLLCLLPSRGAAALPPYRLLAGLLCFGVALFSKETAMLIPVLVIGLEWALGLVKGRAAMARYGLLAGVLVAAVVLRGWGGFLLESSGSSRAEALGQIPWLGFVSRLPRLLGSWCTLLVLPYPLMVTRTIYVPQENLLVPASLGLLLPLGLMWRVWRLPDPALRRLGGMGLVLALLLLVPPLLAVAETGLVGERYLYLPMAFLGLGVAVLLPSVAGLRVLGATGGLLAILFLQLRLPEWRSDVTLFAADHARSPSCLSAAQLGGAYIDAGYPGQALEVLVPDWTGVPGCSQARDVAKLAHAQLEP